MTQPEHREGRRLDDNRKQWLIGIWVGSLGLLVGVLGWLFPDPLSSGFFLFSYHNVVIVAVWLFATLCAVVIWLLMDRSGIGAFGKVGALFAMFLGSVVFVAAGYQLGAPSFKFEGIELLRHEGDISYSHFHEIAGVQYHFGGCERAATTVHCLVSITSLGEDRKASFGRDTTIVDAEGRIRKVSRYEVAGEEHLRGKERLFAANTKTPLLFEFVEVPERVESLSMLKLDGYAPRRTEVIFRRISIGARAP